MSASRPLVAGVCSRLGSWLRWNAWGIRLGLVLLLVVKPVTALLLYLALAVLFGLLDERPATSSSGDGRSSLASPELADRGRRIDALDRRLRRL